MLLVLYDEHGGFFDHVAPSATTAPPIPEGYSFVDREKCEFNTLGLRVPAILVSPWVDSAVFHEQLDHTALLKYLSKKWGLPKLTSRVAASNDFEAALIATPRKLPSAIPMPQARERYEVSALTLPEESGHQQLLRARCEKIEREKLDAGQVEGRVQMQTMPGDTSQEMYRRSLNIVRVIKTKASNDGAGPGLPEH